MGRSRRHQYHRLSRMHQANAMYHPHAINIKALKGLVYHGFDRFFCHARVVFQLQGLDATGMRRIMHITVAHRT